MHLWSVAICCLLVVLTIHSKASVNAENEGQKGKEWLTLEAPKAAEQKLNPEYDGPPPRPNERKRRGVACGVQSLLSPGQIQEVVKAHNDVRKQDGGDQLKLTWDDNLAARAQQWANNCSFTHNMLTDCSNTAVGQNGYMMSGTDLSSVSLSRVVAAWAAEKNNWDFTTMACQAGKVCGHWTQLVWSSTTRVGCGYAKCSTVYGKDTSTVMGSDGLLVFCNYSPGGNVVGAQAFTPGNSCSKCQLTSRKFPATPGYKCPEGLCEPCSTVGDSTCTCGPDVACQNGGTFNKNTCKCDCPIDPLTATLADPNYYYGDACELLCVDKKTTSECLNYKKYNYCTDPRYFTWLRTYCGKTCHTC